MVRRSYSANVERNVDWSGPFETEPYETAWASEAIFFIRALKGGAPGSKGQVQITPDGMHWCNEGTQITLPGPGETTFCKVSNFGGWLRIAGTAETPITVLVTLALKE